MMRGRRMALSLLTLAVGAASSGCDSSSDTSAHVAISAAGSLITINQLASPDFTAISPPRSADATALGGGDKSLVAAATDAGLQSAATVRYLRAVPLSTANGPVDVLATAADFGGTGAAHRWYLAYQTNRLAVAGVTTLSTGSLGDEAFATSVTATADDGTVAAQIVVGWRVANVVNIVVIRGRYGGTRLDDALYLARQQTANEACC